MSELTMIFKQVSNFQIKNANRITNGYFLVFLIIFSLDLIFNFFHHLPLFVAVALVIFPFLFTSTQLFNTQRTPLNLLIISFVVVAILSSIIHVFHVKNISDVLFILLFFTIYFLYKNNYKSLDVRYAILFFLTSFVLFGFSFVGIDAEIYKDALQFKEYILEGGVLKWNNSFLDALEAHRVYHMGLFRLPHIASYFFGFLFIYFGYIFQRKKKWINLLFMILSLFLCFYTGVRTVILTIILALILYAFKRKNIIFLQLVIILGFLSVIFREDLTRISENTIFFQFFSLIQTTVENITRFSRVRIWYSWWVEVSQFGFWDYVIGKSPINAYIANGKNLGAPIWFHNDFLNIFYSYGVWCFMLYAGFFVKIYCDNRSFIMNNIFIFIFYFSMILSAFLNGFYYYFPVFLLYLFFLMIKNEKSSEVIK